MSLARFKLLFIAALAVAALSACSTKPKFYIQIQVLGAETSCQNMEIDFTAYDYQGVLDSLTQVNNPGPRPDSSDLLVLLDQYQKMLITKTAMSDSVNFIRDDLEKLQNTSIEYRKLFPIFQDLQKREQSSSDEVHAVHNKYLEVKGAYQEKLNAWREKAFTGFSEFKAAIPPEQQTKTEVTDQNCAINKLDLPYGQWWLNAELRRPGTINEKLVWNIQLPTEGDSVMILLDESNADIIRELL